MKVGQRIPPILLANEQAQKYGENKHSTLVDFSSPSFTYTN